MKSVQCGSVHLRQFSVQALLLTLIVSRAAYVLSLISVCCNSVSDVGNIGVVSRSSKPTKSQQKQTKPIQTKLTKTDQTYPKIDQD